MKRIAYLSFVALLFASAGGASALGQAPSELPKVVQTNAGVRLVLIPAGEFSMGMSAKGDNVEKDETPAHQVRITRPFYLGTTEVSQRQYSALMNANPSFFEGAEGFPVDRVTWAEAVAFCNVLSEKERFTPYYDKTGERQPGANGFRLPTEAEWEYACRAGKAGSLSFDAKTDKLGDYAWYRDNSGNASHIVGRKAPNAWGLYDMHGNVWEWCEDGYDDAFYGNSPASDPVGPAKAAKRVSRGGSWASDSDRLTFTFRRGGTPTSRDFSRGFRVARTPN